MFKNFSKYGLGAVAYNCNLSYLGGGDQEDCCWEASQTKVSEIFISTNKVGVVVHACNLSYKEAYVGGS
jgi:hypothetical protein